MGILTAIRHLLPLRNSAFGKKTEQRLLPLSSFTLSHLGLRTAYTLHNLGNIVSILRLLHAEYAHLLPPEHNLTLLASYDLLQNMVRHALQPQPERSSRVWFRVREVLDEVLAIFRHHASSPLRTVIVECEGDLELFGSPLLFEQILTNLLDNALRAVSAAQEPYIKLRVTPVQDGIKLDLQNSRSKKPPEPATRNFGLGLFFVQQTVEKEFGGSYEFSLHDTSCETILTFPSTPPASLASEFSASSLQ